MEGLIAEVARSPWEVIGSERKTFNGVQLLDARVWLMATVPTTTLGALEMGSPCGRPGKIPGHGSVLPSRRYSLVGRGELSKSCCASSLWSRRNPRGSLLSDAAEARTPTRVHSFGQMILQRAPRAFRYERIA
jgi:hypothetical protein